SAEERSILLDSYAADALESDDGRFALFHSTDDGIVPGDANGRNDLFLFDRHTGVVVRPSASFTNRSGSSIGAHTIGGHGRFIIFSVTNPREYTVQLFDRNDGSLKQIYAEDLASAIHPLAPDPSDQDRLRILSIYRLEGTDLLAAVLRLIDRETGAMQPLKV